MGKRLRSYRKRLRGIVDLVWGRDYPKSLAINRANRETLDFIATTNATCVAEIGVYTGLTSAGLAQFLGGEGELHLFDFEDTAERVKQKLAEQGYRNVFVHGNTHKTLDSYNWSLMKLLQQHDQPMFDYIFLDGAHTWNVDALTFFLADRLLKTGGHLDFDDYDWSIGSSPSLNPKVYPRTRKLYTEEQIAEKQVKLIVDLLVKTNPRYVEVVPNKIYRKIRPDQ
jgi:predicted O-methyltransferase YrrM